MQRTLTTSAFALLASADKARLNSPILLQTLNELADSPTFFIAPEELTAPIHARSAQITKSSTIQLQSTARRTMFQTGTFLLISVTINWTSMATELIGNGGFLQPMVALPTAVMVGIAGVRWGVWRWNRIKQVWWSGFGSAADGLKQDLSVCCYSRSRTLLLFILEGYSGSHCGRQGCSCTENCVFGIVQAGGK